MALTGNWKASQESEAGALKWGTGINPVHAIHSDDGRGIATGGTDTLVDPSLVGNPWQDYDFADYESAHETPQEDGSADYPKLGTTTDNLRNHAGGFPSWGDYAQGLPGGSGIRGENHGADMGNTPNQTPTEDVAQGWRNKDTGEVQLAVESSQAQVFRQTSDQQLFQTRQGSQRGPGSQSDYEQPIKSRIPGQKVLSFSTGERLYDMEPREQIPRIRGWWSRTAGTGRAAWMQVNAQNPVEPRTRLIPPEPSTGSPVLATTYDDYGYQSEDMIPYA